MKITSAAIISLNLAVLSNAAFIPSSSSTTKRSTFVQRKMGYLDDLQNELNAPDASLTQEDVDAMSKEATNASEEEKDRFGVGDWSSFVDFDEFDGGDGQMGVAGDGNKGLEKFGSDVQPQLAKSKMMSAKNAWGSTTGYADELISKGMETQRAQQLENWQNQQEVRKRQMQAREFESGQWDNVGSEDEDWRKLAKFGVERNQEFDLDEEFGAVIPGTTIDGVIDMKGQIGQYRMHEIKLKNEYMGFADFRAAFTPETPQMDWTIEPKEGSLTSKEETVFTLKFRASGPSVSEGYLVIETEDFKKTYKLTGSV